MAVSLNELGENEGHPSFVELYEKARQDNKVPSAQSFLHSEFLGRIEKSYISVLMSGLKRAESMNLSYLYPIPFPFGDGMNVFGPPLENIMNIYKSIERPRAEPSEIGLSMASLELFAEAQIAIEALEGDRVQTVISQYSIGLAFVCLKDYWESVPFRRGSSTQDLYKIVEFDSEAILDSFGKRSRSIRRYVSNRRKTLESRTQPEPPVRPYPGRDTDQAILPLVDALGLADDAKALAELICLRDPGPPLAIGVFGDWGSGKSTLMAMIEKDVSNISEIERAAFRINPNAPSLFVQNIVQIKFNAWHYTEGNIWASLAAQVFRSLFEQAHAQDDRPRWLTPDRFNSLLKDLSKERAVNKESGASLDSAREALAKARVNAEIKRKRRDRLAAARVGDKDALFALVADRNEWKELDQVLRSIGSPVALGNAAQLAAAAQRSRTAFGRIAAWANATFSAKSLCWALIAIAAAVFIFIAVTVFVNTSVGAWVFSMFVGLSGLIGAASNGALTAYRALVALETADKVIVKEAGQQLADAQNHLELAQAEFDQATIVLAEAEERRAGLEALADANDPEAALKIFLSARLGDAAYRDELGTVSRLHDDFVALSRLLEESEKKYRENIEQRDKAHMEPSHLQRIVLYIDDLDRCDDVTVVKVLEAIHLLLALPLFAVVVGVDSRWLEGALSRRYLDQLGEQGSAAPSDYLEKIFQLAYWLPKLDATNRDGGSYVLLVDALAPELGRQSPVRDEIASAVSDNPNLQAARGGSTTLKWLISNSSEKAAAEQREVLRRKVEFTRAELDCVKALGPLIAKSPRSVKRFMNQYRFVKARLSDRELDIFVGKGKVNPTYPAVMLTLAVEVGLSDSAKRYAEIIDTLMKANIDFQEHRPEILLGALFDYLRSSQPPDYQFNGIARTFASAFNYRFNSNDELIPISSDDHQQMGDLQKSLIEISKFMHTSDQSGLVNFYKALAIEESEYSIARRLSFRRPY
ncbi:MAG: P-loop NTPase fold protein [Oceanicaulis sp.]